MGSAERFWRNVDMVSTLVDPWIAGYVHTGGVLARCTRQGGLITRTLTHTRTTLRVQVCLETREKGAVQRVNDVCQYNGSPPFPLPRWIKGIIHFRHANPESTCGSHCKSFMCAVVLLNTGFCVSVQVKDGAGKVGRELWSALATGFSPWKRK